MLVSKNGMRPHLKHFPAFLQKISFHITTRINFEYFIMKTSENTIEEQGLLLNALQRVV